MDFDIPPEVSCPLCLDLLHEPVSTPCHHAFCRSCIARVLSTGHTSCPLCRRDLTGYDADTAAIDATLVSVVAGSIPPELVTRRAMEMRSRLEILVGNLYEDVPSRGRNSNKWTMYIALRSFSSQQMATLIEKVVYKLHPTFRPSVVVAHPPHFGICRLGWGTFKVECEIHWNRQLGIPPLDVDHYLSFVEGGGRSSANLDVDPELLARVIGYGDEASSTRHQIMSDQRVSQAGSRNRAISLTRSAAQCETVEIVVGNRIERDTDTHENRHRWTLYVMLPGFAHQERHLIDSVDYELRPTFTPAVVSRRSPPFEITRASRSAFPVTCTIRWNAKLHLEPTTITHNLCFDEGGGRAAATVGIRSFHLRKIAGLRSRSR